MTRRRPGRELDRAKRRRVEGQCLDEHRAMGSQVGGLLQLYERSSSADALWRNRKRSFSTA